MNPKEAIITAIEDMKSKINGLDFVSEGKKSKLIGRLDKVTANIPEGTCGSPDVVLAVSVMRDTYTEVLSELLNEVPR